MTVFGNWLLQEYDQILKGLEGKHCVYVCVCVCVCLCVHVVSAALESRRSNGQPVFALKAGPSRKKLIDNTYSLPVPNRLGRKTQTFSRHHQLYVCMSVCLSVWLCVHSLYVSTWLHTFSIYKALCLRLRKIECIGILGMLAQGQAVVPWSIFLDLLTSIQLFFHSTWLQV